VIPKPKKRVPDLVVKNIWKKVSFETDWSLGGADHRATLAGKSAPSSQVLLPQFSFVI